MSAIPEEWLEYPGPGGQVQRQRLLGAGQAGGHLAVLLPGRSYSVGMPALYFPGRLMLGRGCRVLEVDYGFTPAEQSDLTLPEQSDRALAASQAALAAALDQLKPERLTLIGKSLGTLVMAGLLVCGLDLPRTACIWITPILKSEQLLAGMLCLRQMGLVIAGSADPYSDEHGLERLEREAGMRLLVIDKADHSLETPGDVVQSLHDLQRMVRTIDGFMGWGDLRRWWVWT